MDISRLSVVRAATAVRPARFAASVVALGAAAVVLAGCATPDTSKSAAGAVNAPGQQVINGLGSVTVVAQPGDPDSPALTIVHAALYPGPNGTEELRMTVTNQSDADEHLYGVSTSHASTTQILDVPATPGATGQPAGAGGIDLEPGAATTFGPAGPRILLDQPTGLTAGKTVTLNLLFAVAGLIHVTAPTES